MKNQSSLMSGIFSPSDSNAATLAACPFYLADEEACHAGSRNVRVSCRRQALCRSEDHDLCPTYLGYLLRRSRPLRSDCDWLDA